MCAFVLGARVHYGLSADAESDLALAEEDARLCLGEDPAYQHVNLSIERRAAGDPAGALAEASIVSKGGFV